MSFHSIYSKTCPQCAQSVARDAGRCACGHVFIGEDPPNSIAALQATLQEEELYADYLVARAKQAAQAAVIAQSVHAANPGDANKAEEARRALESAETTRAESLTQSARVTKLAEALASHPHNPANPTTRPAAPAHSAAPTTRPMPAVRPPSPAPVPAASSTRPRPAATLTRTAPPPAPAMKSCPLCTARVKMEVMACTCGFSFRPAELQGLDLGAGPGQPNRAAAETGRARLAREAERALQRSRTGKGAVDDAAAAGRARLAREAERALERAQAAKQRECPHCTALVAAEATRCACGYAFDGDRPGAPMPGLSLDPVEQTKLGDLFKRK